MPKASRDWSLGTLGDHMSRLIALADLIKPLLNAIHIVIMLGLSAIAIYSLTQRRNLILTLFTAGALLGVSITTIWFVFSLQSEWNIVLASPGTRQVAYLFIQFAYPLEIVLWAVTFILLINENLRSLSKL